MSTYVFLSLIFCLFTCLSPICHSCMHAHTHVHTHIHTASTSHYHSCHSLSLQFFTHSLSVFHAVLLWSECLLCRKCTFLSLSLLYLVRPLMSVRHHRRPVIKFCSRHLCLMLPAWDGVPVGMPDPSLFPLAVPPLQGAFGQSFHVGAYCTALDRLSPHHTSCSPPSPSQPPRQLQAFTLTIASQLMTSTWENGYVSGISWNKTTEKGESKG